MHRGMRGDLVVDIAENVLGPPPRQAEEASVSIARWSRGPGVSARGPARRHPTGQTRGECAHRIAQRAAAG